MSEAAIHIDKLTRTFQKGSELRKSLDDISLTISNGEVHGLLGPNGAGKTTLCKILSTILLPSSGTVVVEGFNVVKEAKKVRPLLGLCLGGERGLYGRLTAEQNLLYWSALYGVRTKPARKRTASLLKRVGLQERKTERVETYSRGMKQRLHLARSLVGAPRVLILDEPTLGMDPVAALEFRQLVKELKAEGITILVTTHNMAEAEAICDMITLMDRGRIIGTAAPKDIETWSKQVQRIEAYDVPGYVIAELRQDGFDNIDIDKTRILITVDDHARIGDALRILTLGGVTKLATLSPTLEEVYVEVVGRSGMDT